MLHLEFREQDAIHAEMQQSATIQNYTEHFGWQFKHWSNSEILQTALRDSLILQLHIWDKSYIF
jgi:hypothetical protein